jgi:hypothetical protein
MIAATLGLAGAMTLKFLLGVPIMQGPLGWLGLAMSVAILAWMGVRVARSTPASQVREGGA